MILRLYSELFLLLRHKSPEKDFEAEADHNEQRQCWDERRRRTDQSKKNRRQQVTDHLGDELGFPVVPSTGAGAAPVDQLPAALQYASAPPPVQVT